MNEYKIKLEVEPDLISLFTLEEYCVPLTVYVDLEYNGDELLEDTESIQVLHEGLDVTSNLTRKDFDAIVALVSEHVTENSYDIIDKIGEPYETFITDERY